MPIVPTSGLACELCFQIRELAFGAPRRQHSVLERRHAGAGLRPLRPWSRSGGSIGPPRAATSCTLEMVVSNTRLWGAITMTGLVSSTSAI
jgi:hypothetical protein